MKLRSNKTLDSSQNEIKTKRINKSKCVIRIIVDHSLHKVHIKLSQRLCHRIKIKEKLKSW